MRIEITRVKMVIGAGASIILDAGVYTENELLLLIQHAVNSGAHVTLFNVSAISDDALLILASAGKSVTGSRHLSFDFSR